MKQTKQLIGLLEEKNRLFTQYEEITDSIVKFNADKVEGLVKEREKISKLIKKVNVQIKFMCDDSTDGQNMRDAMYNKINWSDCVGDYKDIFKIGQDIGACISRIKRKDLSIVESVGVEKDNILKQIKKLKNSGEAKSVKYYRSTNPMGDTKYKILDSKL